MIKRLEDAVQDRDRIYAVVKGYGINNDGGDKASFSAPSINGQAEAVAMAQAMAGVHPETISYIEAHGTATPVGDPIEVTALQTVFESQTEKKQFCAIGSVKSNIGHTVAAAGAGGADQGSRCRCIGNRSPRRSITKVPIRKSDLRTVVLRRRFAERMGNAAISHVVRA